MIIPVYSLIYLEVSIKTNQTTRTHQLPGGRKLQQCMYSQFRDSTAPLADGAYKVGTIYPGRQQLQLCRH